MPRFPTVFSLIISIAALTFQPTSTFADDPPPTDPTMRTSGDPIGPPPPPSPASPEAWEATVILVLAIFPEADYETVCYYALVWFNLLPPEYPPDPPEDPPACPPEG